MNLLEIKGEWEYSVLINQGGFYVHTSWLR